MPDKETWYCMFVDLGMGENGVLIHEERMTFAEARIKVCTEWLGRNIEIYVPEDFAPYGMEG